MRGAAVGEAVEHYCGNPADLGGESVIGARNRSMARSRRHHHATPHDCTRRRL